MIRQRIISTLIPTTAIAVLLVVTFPFTKGVATSAAPNAGNEVDSAKPQPTDVAALAKQLQELQKQVADLQARLSQMQTPRIIAAGTATFHLVPSRTMPRMSA